MKKKNIFKSLCLTMAIVMSVFLAACQPQENGSQKGSAVPLAAGTVEVWSAHSGVKILRDVSYGASERGEATLAVSMAKNEYESVQLIMTAQAAVSSYNLTAAELSDGAGNKIPVSDISIYNQWYIEVGAKLSNMIYKSGWYPDALVPLDKARAHGDAVIAAGDNQGLWIKFKTRKDTAAGVYTGSFSLNVDGAVFQIPVSVAVWDFAVPDEVNTKSSFLLYGEGLTMGEHDSSIEMRKVYFDYFLDNRISLMNLPCDISDDSFIAAVREYAPNPKLSAYNIPYTQTPTGRIDRDRLEQTIKRLVVASHDDGVDYLEKAYVYNLFIDEFSGSDNKTAKARDWIPAFADLKESIVKYFDTDHGTGYLDSVPGLRHSAATITDLVVSGYNDEIYKLSGGRWNGICPGLAEFHTQDDRDRWRRYFSKEDDEVWWYGCFGPAFPFPSYHIDDNALSARLLSWMQYDYNIDGNLYYMVNQHFGDALGEGYEFFPIDPWTLTPRNLAGGSTAVNGDGWLVYPGARYGITGPVGTIRLENIRDGLEEYEYLKYLDQQLSPLAGAGGYNKANMTATNILRPYLDTLYSGMWPTTSKKLVEDARGAIAEAILLARDYGIVVGETRKGSEYAEADVYLPAGAVINNASLPSGTAVEKTVSAGTGSVVTFRVVRAENSDTVLSFSLTLNGNTLEFVKFLDAARRVLLAFDSAGAAKYTGISSKSTAPVLSEIDGVAAFKYDLVSTTNELEAVTFKPYFTLNSNFMALVTAEMGALTFELYNAGGSDITVSFSRRTSILEAVDLTATLTAGQWTQVTLPIMNLAEILSYRIYLPNRIDGAVQTLYLSKIYSGA